MVVHHGKEPIDGTGGTIENYVFQEIKSDRLSVRTPKEFSDAAQKLVPYITMVYLPLWEILEEPDNIIKHQIFLKLCKIHKVKSNYNLYGIPLIEFWTCQMKNYLIILAITVNPLIQMCMVFVNRMPMERRVIITSKSMENTKRKNGSSVRFVPTGFITNVSIFS